MSVAEWYYIGHYGQLGPLTKEQIDELVEGSVIERETYVWRNGMPDWLPAERVAELQASFATAVQPSTPPPPPSMRATATLAPPIAPTFEVPSFRLPVEAAPFHPSFGMVRSDKSRILAGLLQFIPPGGIGRMYLGYAAIGVVQLLLSCVSVGYVWSIIDGIIILTGGTNRDGYGRVLPD
ncbi:MAG TPA: GYF domain-containing protein [Fimbriimonas sp.]